MATREMFYINDFLIVILKVFNGQFTILGIENISKKMSIALCINK